MKTSAGASKKMTSLGASAAPASMRSVFSFLSSLYLSLRIARFLRIDLSCVLMAFESCVIVDLLVMTMNFHG